MALPESEAIPYEPHDLRGERLLVLAPHPDDEVIGCGGLIALHVREGRQVRVVVVTDGAEAGNATVREEESRRALRLLGNIQCDFLGFHDRRLAEESDALKNRMREILIDFKPVKGSKIGELSANFDLVIGLTPAEPADEFRR